MSFGPDGPTAGSWKGAGREMGPRAQPHSKIVKKESPKPPAIELGHSDAHGGFAWGLTVIWGVTVPSDHRPLENALRQGHRDVPQASPPALALDGAGLNESF